MLMIVARDGCHVHDRSMIRIWLARPWGDEIEVGHLDELVRSSCGLISMKIISTYWRVGSQQGDEMIAQNSEEGRRGDVRKSRCSWQQWRRVGRIRLTPQVQLPAAQPQLEQEQEAFPQPPIVDDVWDEGLVFEKNVMGVDETGSREGSL